LFWEAACKYVSNGSFEKLYTVYTPTTKTWSVDINNLDNMNAVHTTPTDVLPSDTPTNQRYIGKTMAAYCNLSHTSTQSFFYVKPGGMYSNH
jgi:hypothetical protein